MECSQSLAVNTATYLLVPLHFQPHCLSQERQIVLCLHCSSTVGAAFCPACTWVKELSSRFCQSVSLSVFQSSAKCLNLNIDRLNGL